MAQFDDSRIEWEPIPAPAAAKFDESKIDWQPITPPAAEVPDYQDQVSRYATHPAPQPEPAPAPPAAPTQQEQIDADSAKYGSISNAPEPGFFEGAGKAIANFGKSVEHGAVVTSRELLGQTMKWLGTDSVQKKGQEIIDEAEQIQARRPDLKPRGSLEYGTLARNIQGVADLTPIIATGVAASYLAPELVASGVHAAIASGFVASQAQSSKDRALANGSSPEDAEKLGNITGGLSAVFFGLVPAFMAPGKATADNVLPRASEVLTETLFPQTAKEAGKVAARVAGGSANLAAQAGSVAAAEKAYGLDTDPLAAAKDGAIMGLLMSGPSGAVEVAGIVRKAANSAKLRAALSDPEAPDQVRAAAAATVGAKLWPTDNAAARNFMQNAANAIYRKQPVDMTAEGLKPAEAHGGETPYDYTARQLPPPVPELNDQQRALPQPEVPTLRETPQVDTGLGTIPMGEGGPPPGTPALPRPGEVAIPMGEAKGPYEVPTQTPGEAHAAKVEADRAAVEQRRAALTQATQAPARPAAPGEVTASKVTIDPNDPAASFAAIAAAPITPVSAEQPAPASVNPQAHQEAAGDLAAMFLHADQLNRQAKLTPPKERQAVLAEAQRVAGEARTHIDAYRARYGNEAASHLHTTAAQVYHGLKGDYRTLVKPTSVQESGVSTEREQPTGVNNAESVRSDAGQVREGGSQGQPSVQPGAVEGGRDLQQPAPEGPGGGQEGRGDRARGPEVAVPETGTTAPKLGTEVDRAAHAAAASPTNDLTPPTAAQVEAGNYKMGHPVFSNGLAASIETPSTAYREDKQHVPPRWRRQMKGVHYGYWKQTEGADGIRARLAKLPAEQQKRKGRREGVDVMIKEGTKPDYNGPVFVVDQVNQRGGFDEHKTMVGFATEQEARDAYQAQYPAGWKGLGNISQTTMSGLKTWMRFGDMSKPYADRVIASGAATKQEINLQQPVEMQKPAETEYSYGGAPVTDVKLGSLLGDDLKVMQGITHRVPQKTLDGSAVKAIGGRKMDFVERKALAGLLRDAEAMGVPAHRFSSLEGFFVFTKGANMIGASVTTFVDGKPVTAIGFNVNVLMSDNESVRKGAIFTLLHEGAAGHELDRDPDHPETSITSSSPTFGVRIVGGEAVATGALMQEAIDNWKSGGPLSALLSYPLAKTAYWMGYYGTSEAERKLKAEVFAQLGPMWYTDRALLKREAPVAYKLFEEIHNATSQQGAASERVRADRVAVRDALRSRGSAWTDELGADGGIAAHEAGPGKRKAGARVEGGGVSREAAGVVEPGVREERAGEPAHRLLKQPSARSKNNALDIREHNRKPLGEKASLMEIGQHLDKLVRDEYGGPLDIHDPRAMARATAHAIAEVRFQVRQARTGLDWYEEDIQHALDLTSRYIPALAHGTDARSPLGAHSAQVHRQAFTIIAGMHSPHMPAARNWENAGIAYEIFVRTGRAPEVNPETGSRWGDRVSPLPFAHFNSMVEDMGLENAVKWLLSTHTVAEITAKKFQYGIYVSEHPTTGRKYAGTSGKSTDIKYGLYMYGEKVGPFTLGLNGINTEVAVDVWAGRTLHRYMGTNVRKQRVDGELKDVMVDGPQSEEERAAFKQIAIDTAGATGYNPNQVQAVLWFFEQQLYTQLGLNTANPKFSDGARDLLERVGLDATDTGTAAGTVEERGARAGAPAEAGQAQQAGRTVVNIGLDTADGLGIFPAEAVNALRAQGVKVTSREVRRSGTEETLIATLDRPLTPAEAHAVAVELRQEAIVQKVGDKGELYGPNTAKWGPFSEEHFLEPGQQDVQAHEVTPEEMRGDGRGFTDFFTEASKGNRAPDKSIPYKPVLDISSLKEFSDEYVKHRGNFDDHIATSIPGFREVQQAVGDAIVKTYADRSAATLLDIGGSEGAFNKTITEMSDGRIFTLVLDPNVQMGKFFEEHSEVPGAEYDVAALGTHEQEGKLAWTEDDGTKIKFFKPIEKYDVVHEAMVFQFISNTRDAQFARVKQLMKPLGIALFEEKVIDDTPQWRANEAQKDAYKAQYYSQAQIAAKKKEVLAKGAEAVRAEESAAEQKVVGMNDLMVSTPELEAVLQKHWHHVAQYWDSGNFKGYVASDDRRALEKFLDSLVPLDSKYSTTATPRYLTPRLESQEISGMQIPTTPAFRKWFGESKVVDENGDPLVVYHGSLSELTRFERGKVSENSFAGPGFYFTTSAEDASHNYADIEGPDQDIKLDLMREDLVYDEEMAHDLMFKHNVDNMEDLARTMLGFENQGVVYPVYLRIENPYIIERIEGVRGDNDTSMNENDVGPPEDYDSAEEFRAAVEAAGYDGVEDRGPARFNMFGVDESTKHYVAFKPTQVKSATGNRGTYSPRNQDIAAQEISGQTIPGNQITWDAPAETRTDAVIRTLQDKHVDTKKVVAAIKQFRGRMSDAVDVYLKEELYHGRAAKETLDFVDRELNPLVNDMAMRHVSIPELEAFLHARHAEERNIQIAKVNPKMPDGGSGMSTAAARAYLASIPAQRRATLNALATRVDSITAQTGRILVNYGLESQSTVDAWNNAYRHYVPLHRTDMDRGEGTGGGRGFSVKGKSKRATGSGLPVEHILANIALAREQAITRGEKNRVASALVGLATQNPNPSFWQVDRPPRIKYIGPNGTVVETVDPMFKSRENVVVARMPDASGNVVEHAVIFNESNDRAMHMAKALNNIDAAQIGEVLGAVGKITRFLASINTQYNPVFGIVNLTRDTQQSVFNLTTTPIHGQKLKVLSNIIPALVGVYRDLRAERAGRPAPSAWASTFEDFQRAGAQTGYRDLFVTAEDRAKAIQRELARAEGGKGRAMVAVGRWVAEWLSDYNSAMENAVRLAAFKVARDSGVSTERSASIAKNITVNFNRKGNASSQIGALYAFFNASAQGTARLVEVMKGPAGGKIIAGGIILGVLQAIALAAAGFDDDEPPQWVRERNTIIPIGGKKYIMIPMPLGLHILPNIGRVATEIAMRQGKDSGKQVLSLIGTAIDAFNPLGSATPLQTLTPTVMDPFAALAENRDFTGKPIAKTNSSGLAPKPGHLLARDTATSWSRFISQAINEASGGTAYTPGMFSPTPDQIDYLIGQFTGGIGRELGKAQQTASSAMTGEPMPSYKIPVVGRYYGDAAEQTNQSAKFYDNVQRINEVDAQIKGLKSEHKFGEARAYHDDHPESRMIDQARTAESLVSDLRRQRSKALAAEDAGRVKRLDDKINEAMTRFNEKVKALR